MILTKLFIQLKTTQKAQFSFFKDKGPYDVPVSGRQFGNPENPGLHLEHLSPSMPSLQAQIPWSLQTEFTEPSLSHSQSLQSGKS